MKMSVKLVLAAVSAVALCCAQGEPTPPGSAAPVAKITAPDGAPSAPPPVTAAAQAAPEVTAPPKQGPQVIDDTPAPLPAKPFARAQDAGEKKGVGEKSEKTTVPLATGNGKSAPYVIGALDVLVVKVWNNQPLSGVIDVHQDGNITM